MQADIGERRVRPAVAADVDERLGDAVDERLGADEPVVGQHRGSLRKMFAAAEADLEMQWAIVPEQALGGHRTFGGGEHLAYRADLLPDHGFIGAEPFVNCVAQELVHVRDGTLANVRLHHGDALEVLQRIPDGSLAMLYLLHPDPWPKNKHAKRRMMNDGPVDLFAAKLKPGGEFRFGTDHPVYLRHALSVMRRHTDAFEWQVDGRRSWEERPSGWCETRYEHKARTVYGHEVWYFRYKRR